MLGLLWIISVIQLTKKGGRGLEGKARKRAHGYRSGRQIGARLQTGQSSGKQDALSEVRTTQKDLKEYVNGVRRNSVVQTPNVVFPL